MTQSFIWINRTLQFFVVTNFAQIVMFPIQNKFAYPVFIFNLQEKMFLWWRHTYITDTGCLLRGAMSLGKVTIAFSYSFNVFYVSHSSLEESKGKIADWITGV